MKTQGNKNCPKEGDMKITNNTPKTIGEGFYVTLISALVFFTLVAGPGLIIELLGAGLK